MALHFRILGSSSSGNCALLESDGCRVLIDAGFSGRRILAMLDSCGLSIEAIDAVFLTHEHQDHSIGLKVLSRFEHLRVFANRDTAEAVQRQLTRQARWSLFETGSQFRFKDLDVTTFALPHDAYDPVGFVFNHGGEDLFNPRCSIAWVTDLGHIPPNLEDCVRNADVLVIEANYDADLLERDPRRPFSVKQRISGRHGHLSNAATRSFLQQVQQPRWQQVYLAHLSKDCNNVGLVREYFSTMASQVRYRTEVIDPTSCEVSAYVWQNNPVPVLI